MVKNSKELILCAATLSPFKDLHVPHHSLFFFDSKNKKLEQLTPNSISVAYPSFSTDKKQILFTGVTAQDIHEISNTDCYGASVSLNIYIVQMNGSGLKKIISNGEQPKWIRAKSKYF